MRKVTLLLALTTLAFSALGLFVGQGTLATQQEPDGPGFTIRCTWEGDAAGNVDIGPVTCTLKVTGLPDPLQDDVTITLFTTGGADEDTGDSTPVASFVSADVQESFLGMPVFVSRQSPAALPPPLPRSPQVPAQPPQSL